ncbi:uncharacterized protein LOC119565830 [Chelonia mydas]|uniref:uncharacterized protein LOC119565830 n=1 Tax=Chelonia mydas TaxID=8469 RepID=UPI0018A21660|nr:uncharacterized protein LOC119565830 [Chelonia mydas]
MDTSEPSTARGEEEDEGNASKGAEAGGDTPESLDACSQELFSSQEEGSQSWRPVLGEGQTPEEVSGATLRSQPLVLSLADRLRALRKRSRKSKEDMLQEVMQQSVEENRKAQKWRESERRIRQKNEDCQQQNAVLWQQSTDWLISIMERQADSIQALVTMQAEHNYARRPLQPLSQNSFPCAPMSPPTHFAPHLGSYCSQLPPTPLASPSTHENYDPYPLHSTPRSRPYSHPEVQHSVHSTPDRIPEYEIRTYSSLWVNRSPPYPLAIVVLLCYFVFISRNEFSFQ